MSIVEARPAPVLTAGWTVWRRNIIETVPRLDRRRDETLPLIVAGSLALHAAVILSLFLTQRADVQVKPLEIPVQIIQLPPRPEPKKDVAKPAPPKPTAAKPDAAKAAPKPPAPKPQAAKSEPKPAAKEPPKPQPKPPEKPAAKTTAKPQPPKQVQKEPAKPPPPKPQPPAKSTAERLKDLLGPMPGLGAVALPGASEAGTEEVSFSQLVMSRIAKAKKEGRYPGVPGYATVEFILGDGGEVTRLELRRPSGDPSLDTEAIDLVKRAEPFPAPPPGGRRDYVVTLQFKEMP